MFYSLKPNFVLVQNTAEKTLRVAQFGDKLNDGDEIVFVDGTRAEGAEGCYTSTIGVKVARFVLWQRQKIGEDVPVHDGWRILATDNRFWGTGLRPQLPNSVAEAIRLGFEAIRLDKVRYLVASAVDADDQPEHTEEEIVAAELSAGVAAFNFRAAAEMVGCPQNLFWDRQPVVDRMAA